MFEGTEHCFRVSPSSSDVFINYITAIHIINRHSIKYYGILHEKVGS